MSDNHRRGQLSAGHEMHLGQMIDELIAAFMKEIHVHYFRDRAITHNCSSCRGANYGVLRERCISDPFWSELLEQTLRDFESSTEKWRSSETPPWTS